MTRRAIRGDVRSFATRRNCEPSRPRYFNYTRVFNTFQASKNITNSRNELFTLEIKHKAVDIT